MLRFDLSKPVTQLDLLTKAKSMEFGRRLYQFKQDDACYWLKLHLSDTETTCEQAFQQELVFYQRLSIEQSVDFLMPFQVLNLTDLSWLIDSAPSQGLLLPHAQSYWSNPAELSLTQITAMIWDCLCSLEALHQLGWIHGDLKAEHFVCYQDKLKLLDFEQAHPVHAIIQPQLSATPRYMAPELFHAQPKSMQTDLYALGIILYEWLKQQRFSARSYEQWAILHCQSLRIELPQRFLVFMSLLHGLLAKSLTQRFDHIQQAKQALMRLNLLKNEHN